MSEQQRSDPVGTVAEEAVKLFGVFSDLARDRGAGPGEGAGAAGERIAAAAADVTDHVGGADCTYCPVCRAVDLVRRTSPEVRDHLAAAATSLAQAAAALLATDVSDRTRGGDGERHVDPDDYPEHDHDPDQEEPT